MQNPMLENDSSSYSGSRTHLRRSSASRLRSTVIDSIAPSTHNGAGSKRYTDEGSTDGDERKPAARRHVTRAKNGVSKRRVDRFSPHNEQEARAEAEMLESCAVSLASLDARAFARAQLTDTNALLSNLILPMSLPWAHLDGAHSRLVAYDIEDLPALKKVGTDEPRPFAHSEASPSPTQDSGTVEFLISTQKSGSTAEPNCFLFQADVNQAKADPNLPGERSLRLLEAAHWTRKRRRLTEPVPIKETKRVSFKFGSSSSRMSIFRDVPPGQCLLSLPASLPKFIQDGLRRTGQDALNLARELGPYNCRIIEEQERDRSADSGSPRTYWVGRDRRIWTDREREEGSFRYTFRSLLTGETIKSSDAKRPLQIKVGIRLNGRLLSSQNSDSSTGDEYDATVLEDALDAACSDTVCASRPQCYLDDEKFLAAIVNNTSVPASASDQQESLLQAVRQRVNSTPQKPTAPKTEPTMVFFVPPKLDCLPTEEGLLNVVCTTPGRLDLDFPGDPTAADAFMQRIATKFDCCFICWQRGLSEDVGVRCTQCGVGAHRCCIGTPEFVCSSCRPGSLSSIGQKCSVCNKAGGHLEQMQPGQWVHLVCKHWTDWSPTSNHTVTNNGNQNRARQRCDICSKSSQQLVECAAENCAVKFHPMCAIVGSLCVEARRGDLNLGIPEQHDAFLCSQYCLTELEVTGQDKNLPIGFCGYHNPQRETTYRGLYPGAHYLQTSMHVPPKRL